MSQKGWGQMPCFLRQVGVFRSETSHKKHVSMKIYIQLMKVFWAEKLSMLADPLSCRTVTSHEEARPKSTTFPACLPNLSWIIMIMYSSCIISKDHDIFTLCWHHTDINISTGTVPLTAWGSGNVNHHLLPLQGANGFTWYFEKDDVVLCSVDWESDSGELVMSWKITIDHIDLYWCIDSICTIQKGLKFQTVLLQNIL